MLPVPGLGHRAGTPEDGGFSSGCAACEGPVEHPGKRSGPKEVRHPAPDLLAGM